jgi:thiol-disulfide isomerase/thioredoxin
MAPIVHGLEEKFGDQIHFAYLDMDDPQNEKIRRELGVGWPPVFYMLDEDGNVIDRRYLYKETAELEEIFMKVLGE